MVLADSEGVIVAVVMFVMIDLVSSSSLSSGGVMGLVTVAKGGDRGGGCPLLSFYSLTQF